MTNPKALETFRGEGEILGAGMPPERSDPRFTLMIIPEGGRGGVRQRVVSLRGVRAAAAVAVSILALLGVGAGLAAWTLPRALEHDRIAAENAELGALVDAMDDRVKRMETVVTRVTAVDDQIREASLAGRLPGSGPLTTEAAALFAAWLEGRELPPSTDMKAGSPLDRARDLADATEELEGDVGALLSLLPGIEDHLNLLAGRETGLPDRWPLSGSLTSSFGWRRSPFGGHMSFHSGIDIGVPEGTPVVATAAGVVTRSDGDARSGHAVVIDHGDGVVTSYLHCSVLVASVGDEVLAGDLIAYSGNSGLSTGPHLHYQLLIDGEAVDALDYLP